MIKVGTNSFGYNHYRNFAGLPFEDIHFEKVFDLYKIPAHWHFKLRNKVVQRYINRFNDLGLNKVDMYHFFNTLTPVKKPWVVTFETTIPRLDADFKKGYEWLAGKWCKKIIGYTERAIKAQEFQLERFPEYKQAILSKMMLLYPSQRRLVDNISTKRYDEEIVFTITGSCFFLKGGWELLQAFERLKSEKAPVRLNVVSKLEVLGYKDLHATPELVARTRKMLASNPLITHYNGLPNQQVIELLKKSHVGILPSYGETFGYSILEAMACGCSVIATSVPPFPEFVQEPWGWLINVPVKTRNGLYYTETDDAKSFSAFSAKLTEGIYNTVREVIEDRDLLRNKCMNAINRISDFHDPLNRVHILQNIYRKALTD